MNNDILTYEELIECLENDSSESPYKTLAEFLMTAIMDWPTKDLREPNEFLTKLTEEIKDKLTYRNLIGYSKKIKPETDAWKCESISSVLELFDINQNNSYNSELELSEILEKITNHYRQKKLIK